MSRSLLSQQLADYVYDLQFQDLPAKVIEEAKARIIDSIGVALAAIDAQPVRISRKIAENVSSKKPATIFGTSKGTSPDLASFVNGCMVRYLDFLDTYLSKEALHPSDNIPAVIAAAEFSGASAKDVIVGTVAAYEICCRLADAASIRARGWDHVTYIAISSAAAAGKVMGLEAESIAQAINLATVSNVSLRQTRAGELSMWKGCAAANATRNGVFAAMLAREGMKGPSPIFEGEMGFWKQVSGKFEIPRLGDGKKVPFRISMTSLKKFPVEYHAMSAVEAAMKVREKVDLEKLAEIVMETFDVAYRIIVKDPEKWNPKTRETADHSLPYIVAATLLDGAVSLDTFTPEKIRDERIKSLIKKMRVRVKPSYNKVYPRGIPNTVRVVGKDGRKVEETVTYPKGHYKNPMSRDDVEAKFRKLTNRFPENRIDEILARLWNLENENLVAVISLLGQ